MITWPMEATTIAPWISSIRICHSCSFSLWLKLLVQPLTSSKSAGHLFSGSANIANVGTKNENVPPCTIGSLKFLSG